MRDVDPRTRLAPRVGRREPTHTDSAAAGIPAKPAAWKSHLHALPPQPPAKHLRHARSREYPANGNNPLPPRKFSRCDRPSIVTDRHNPACFIAQFPQSLRLPLPTARCANRPHAHASGGRFARSRMKRVTLALSFTGFVSACSTPAVNPPRAAARVPVSIVSDDSCPGSRR